jgi:hypothetical protein
LVWNGVHSTSWVQLRNCLKEKVTAPIRKSENTAVGIRHAGHVASCPQKLALISPTIGGHKVGIVRSWTQTTKFSLLVLTRFISLYKYWSW